MRNTSSDPAVSVRDRIERVVRFYFQEIGNREISPDDDLVALYQADPAVDVFLLLEKFKREFGIEDVDFAQSNYQTVRTVGDIETAVNAHRPE